MSLAVQRAVDRMVALRGESLDLIQRTAGTYDDATGTVTGITTSTTAFVGFVRSYSSRDLDGTVVLRGDLEVRASGKALGDASLVPASGDHVTRSGTQYRVVNVERHDASGLPLVVVLQIRGVD